MWCGTYFAYLVVSFSNLFIGHIPHMTNLIGHQVVSLSKNIVYIRMCGLIILVFVLGEAKLEMYLEENPPVESNISKARTTLTEAKR